MERGELKGSRMRNWLALLLMAAAALAAARTHAAPVTALLEGRREPSRGRGARTLEVWIIRGDVAAGSVQPPVSVIPGLVAFLGRGRDVNCITPITEFPVHVTASRATRSSQSAAIGSDRGRLTSRHAMVCSDACGPFRPAHR